jgi:hypothetical protein
MSMMIPFSPARPTVNVAVGRAARAPTLPFPPCRGGLGHCGFWRPV